MLVSLLMVQRDSKQSRSIAETLRRNC